MDEAAKELARQLARRQRIAELLVPARAAVEDDKEANKGVLGRPKLPRMNKTNRLLAAVSDLENNRLPGEYQRV